MADIFDQIYTGEKVSAPERSMVSGDIFDRVITQPSILEDRNLTEEERPSTSFTWNMIKNIPEFSIDVGKEAALDTAAAMAYMGAGGVKGVTLGYADPTQALEKTFLAERNISKPIAGITGQFIGAMVPIVATSSAVGAGLQMSGALKGVRPVLRHMVQSGVTGGLFGAAHKPEEEGISKRIQNAMDTSAVFIVMSGAGELVDRAAKAYRLWKSDVKALPMPDEARVKTQKEYQSLRSDIIERMKRGGATSQQAEQATDIGIQTAIKEGGGWKNVTTKDLNQARKAIKEGKRIAIQREVPPKSKAEPPKPKDVFDEIVPVKESMRPTETVGPKETFTKTPIVYHGTKHGFQEFESSKLGKATNAPSAREGFFFTSSRKVAEGYATYGEGANVQALKEKADKLEKIAQRSGKNSDWDKYDEAYREYENASLAESETGGPFGDIKTARLKMNNPLIEDFRGQAFQEGEAVNLMKKAKAEGYDGVIFKNVADDVNTPVRAKGKRPDNEISDVYAVFDKSQIEIEAVAQPSIVDMTKDVFDEAIPTKPTETLQPLSRISPGEITKTAKELRAKWAEDNPDKKVPKLEDFKQMARQSLPPEVGVVAPEPGIKTRVMGGVEPKVYTESQALRGMFATQQRIAGEVYRTAQKEMVNMKRELTNVIKEKIPVDDRGQFLSMVANVKNQKEMGRALDKVNEVLVRIEQRRSVSELRNLIKDVRPNIKYMRPEYRDAIQEIVDGVDISKPTKQKIERLESLAEYLEANPENTVPQNKINELKRLRKKAISDMSQEEIRDISDAINHLVKLEELKNKLIVRGKIREFVEAKKEALSNLERSATIKPPTTDIIDSFEREPVPGFVKKIFFTHHLRPETQTFLMDHKDNGIIQDIVYRGIDDGVSETLRFSHMAQDFMREKIQGIDVSRWGKPFQKKSKDVIRHEIPLTGNKKVIMTPGEKIRFYNHTRNIKNLDHILEGGFAFENNISKIHSVTMDDVELINRSLTIEEKRVADAIMEFNNTIAKDAINQVSLELNGYEIAREDNYTPIRTNFLDRFHDDLIKQGKNFSQMTLEGMGILKERQGAKNAIILDDAFSSFYKHVNQVASYVGLARPLRSAKALLNDNDFQIKMRRTGRSDMLGDLKEYIEQVEGGSVRFDNFEKLTQDLINKLDVAVLGLDPWVMAKQPVSYILSGTQMDMKYIIRAVQDPFIKEDLSEMYQYHPQLRDRLEGNVTRELGEIAHVGGPLKFWVGQTTLSNKFMEGIRRFDQQAVARIWKAAKYETQDLHPELSGQAYWDHVADRAWTVIRRTQPTFHKKDRSHFGRSRAVLTRLWTKYSSQRNKNFNIAVWEWMRYQQSAKTPEDKARLGKNITLLAVVAPLLLIGIDEMRGITYGYEKKRSLFNYVLDFLNINFGNVYFAGNIFNTAKSQVQLGKYAGYDIDDVFTQTMELLAETIGGWVAVVQQMITQERYRAGKKAGELKFETAMKNALRNTMDLTGRLTGIPVDEMRRMASAGFRIVGGKRKIKPYVSTSRSTRSGR